MRKEEAIEEVKILIEEFKPTFRLQNWNIKVKWGGGVDKEMGGTLMVVFNNSEYKMATIKVFGEYLKFKSLEEREQLVIHELCHILVDELENFKNKHINALQEMIEKLSEDVIERTVENLAQSFYNLRKKK